MSDSVVNDQIVVRAKLLESLDDTNGYTILVFENLDSDDWTNKYIMCVRYPNWEGSIPEKNIVGFLQYTYIYAGNSYYNRMLGQQDTYQFSHVRFDKFLPLKEKVDSVITL